MSLKTRGILVLVIGSILGVSLSVGGNMLAGRDAPPPRELTWEQANLLREVMERVQRDYVEPIDEAELLDNAIRGMVADLDPHSAFLDADEYQDIRISTTGRYSGVGLEVSSAEERILVISPIDGTPAARAGVEAGDEIISIDDVSVLDDGLDDTINKLRGDRSVGYLRLSQFNVTTIDEAGRAIDRMMDEAQGETGNMLTGLILDLRNNPGGILDSAVDISDLFLNDGIIVSAQGRTPESRFVRTANEGDILDGATIVVLVNGGSASASEIVAGALQDHNRATIVGTRTFGKGLVQTVVPLSRGRAIKLTTSHYFTPSGDSINEIGVTPDVYIEGDRGVPGWNLNGHPDRENDAQLIEALELIRNEPVMHSRAID
jgi:carboxyl-terminal processing protease